MSRKFLVALLVLAASCGLLWSGRIGEATWSDVVIWVTGLYLGGNVSQALVDAWGRR